MPASPRHYPGRTETTCSLVPFPRLRPSLSHGRVSSRLAIFEACSAFPRVRTYQIAESPGVPFPRISAASLPPPPLRLLPGGTNQFPGGSFTRRGSAPSTAHRSLLAYASLVHVPL